MWDHVTLRATDFGASARFYDIVLRTLGIERIATRIGSSTTTSSRSHPRTTRSRRRGACTSASRPRRASVHAFWQAGVDAAYRDDGEPGLRPEYGPDYYGGFLLDPDGDSAEAVHHDLAADRDAIDHLWIRVADVAAARAFYAAIAPHTGAEPASEPRGRARFAGRGSFSVVAGTPTENLHMAFPAADRAAVEAFHRDTVGAGYRDNGGPGERPEYHAGYYGAFVLDPDGNNIELVFHERG